MLWILLGILLLIPFQEHSWTLLGDSLPEFLPQLTAIKVLGAIGTVGAAWSVATKRADLRSVDCAATRWFCVYVFAIAVAAIASGATSRAVARQVGVTLLFPVVIVAVRGLSEVRTVLYGATVAVLVGLLFAYLQYARYGEHLGIEHYERNYFALLIVLVTPLAFVFARSQQALLPRYLWYGAFAALLVSALVTGSRGAFVATGALVVLMALQFARHRALVAVLGLVGLVAATALLPGPTWQRLLATTPVERFRDTGVRASTSTRLGLVSAGVRMMAQHPLVGVGLGKFRQVSGDYEELRANRQAHNLFLQIGAESGIPALLAFCGFLAALFGSLRSIARRALFLQWHSTSEWATALQIGLAGFLVSSLFLSTQFEKLFWLLAFVAIVLHCRLDSAEPNADKTAVRVG